MRVVGVQQDGHRKVQRVQYYSVLWGQVLEDVDHPLAISASSTLAYLETLMSPTMPWCLYSMMHKSLVHHTVQASLEIINSWPFTVTTKRTWSQKDRRFSASPDVNLRGLDMIS